MKKLLYSIILLFSVLTIQAQTPAVTMTTATSIGSTFSFGISAIANSTPIQVDWGDGSLANYSIGTGLSTLTSTLSGSIIKVFGGNIVNLDLSSKKIVTLDVSNATLLNNLNCYDNLLTSIDLSNNIFLTELSIALNGLTSLDITKNIALINLWCGDNYLTTIDITKNTALTHLNCPYNKLTSIDITNNPSLLVFHCSNNQITTLNVINNTLLKYLYCQSNQLTFNTLPIKQLSWTTYTYSPQKNYSLPKKTYSTLENINLSSQLTVNSNTTTFVWKTKSGAILTPGVDFTSINGNFTFLKAQTDSIYCQMTNTSLPDLTLSTKAIAINQIPPVITMTTNTAMGNIFSFDLEVLAYNTPIQVDWGNGTLSNYCTIYNNITITGVLTNNTIKIYGNGISGVVLGYSNQLTNLDVSEACQLKNLNCYNNLLTSLDVSKNTELTSLSLAYNKLTSLDVSNNSKLTSLNCSFNKLTSLDVSILSKLTSLDISYNQLTSLDVSNNNELSFLYCRFNNLTFSSLPFMRPSWFYLYDYQADLKLLKNKYNVNEIIDLSGQLTVDGNNTVYTWKTAGNIALVKGVDYSEDNGKFVFLAAQGDYIYCQMTNTSLPSLILNTEKILIPSTDPLATMVSSSAIGNALTFYLYNASNNNTIQVDWGNGIRIDYIINSGYTTISGSLTGSTIKLFGFGIYYLNLSSDNLTSLDISKANALSTLECRSNQLTFSTLPLKQSKWDQFNYFPQASLKLPKQEYKINETIDLSDQLTGNGNNTLFEWKTTHGETLVKGVDYSEDNGKIKFLIEQGDYIYCQMTNANFPLLILTTDTISVPPLTPIVTMSTNRVIGDPFAFKLINNSNSYIIEVDWGNGMLIDYTINSGNVNISGILSGSTIKIYGLSILYLDLSSTNITSLDISKANILNTLYCNSNQLTFSTLPLKQSRWTDYLYHSQALVKLPKQKYAPFETIDLSNQLIIGGNTTVYIWKTAGGATLVNNLDYTENNGKFTFLAEQGDYLYCQMTNSSFPNLTLTTETITVPLSNPTITMTTSTYIGSPFSFDISTTKYGAIIQVDWGNGTLENFTTSSTISNVSRSILGNNIKIYGAGIYSLSLPSNNITALDVSKVTALKNLNCISNQLTFSTLPIKQAAWTDYNYSPQKAIKLPKKNYTITETLDLSNQLTSNGNTTAYIWKTKSGTTLTSGVDYNVNNGVFTFLKAQTDSVYCQMTNATFPNLTLYTTYAKVTQFPTSVDESNLNISVYPNPVKELMNIEFNENITKVEIFTITGVKIYEIVGKNTNKMVLPTADLPKGMLLVKVYGRNGVMERKVVKE